MLINNVIRQHKKYSNLKMSIIHVHCHLWSHPFNLPTCFPIMYMIYNFLKDNADNDAWTGLTGKISSTLRGKMLKIWRL